MMAGDLPPTDGGGPLPEAGDFPPPEPIAPPTPGGTIGDLIDAERRAQDAKTAAMEALAKANDDLKAATEAASSAEAALASGLATTGPAFDVEEDGTASIYSLDGSGSFHVTTARPRSTPAGS